MSSTVDLKLEVVVIPVTDVDRALTPPGSPCSIHLRQRDHNSPGGLSAGTWLIVSDIEAARAELIDRGVEISGVFQVEGGRR